MSSLGRICNYDFIYSIEFMDIELKQTIDFANNVIITPSYYGYFLVCFACICQLYICDKSHLHPETRHF